jgi:hypothetical protein
MVWAEVVGPSGLVASEHVKLGCFLLSPNFVYPVHGHQALEIYTVVAGAVTFAHGLDRPSQNRVAAPGYSVTPEGAAHALQTGPEPVLIVYCWTGDLVSPIWWWDRASDGAWTKFFPAKAGQR